MEAAGIALIITIVIRAIIIIEGIAQIIMGTAAIIVKAEIGRIEDRGARGVEAEGGAGIARGKAEDSAVEGLGDLRGGY